MPPGNNIGWYDNFFAQVKELNHTDQAAPDGYMWSSPKFRSYTPKETIVKEKKYIPDDVDIMSKISEQRDMVVLTSEEVKKAVVNQRPDYKILESLLKGSEYQQMHAIGTFFRGSFDPKSITRSYYLLLGQGISGKVYEDNQEAATAYKVTKPKVNDIKYMLFDIAANKLIVKSYLEATNYISPCGSSDSLLALSLLRYNIIDSTLSGRVFGFANGKAKMVGSVNSIKIEHGSSVKLGQDSYYAIIFDELTNKNVKFCLSDLQVVLPKVKGYNFPKDTTIKKGSNVTIKGSETQFVVRAVHINPASKRLNKRGTTRALDVLQIDSITNMYDSRKVYAKNVKLV